MCDTMGKHDDEILTRYQTMTQTQDCDPILVQAKITLIPFIDTANNRTTYKKNIQIQVMPVIITPERYLAFRNDFKSEFRDMGMGLYQKIFWFKPTRKTKSIEDLFAENIESIYAFFNKVKNVKFTRNDKGGIILP